jgi:hypothetical protein
MPRRKNPITRELRDRLQVTQQIDVPPEIARELDAYLEDQIPKAMRERDQLLPRVEKWRKTIAGERATPGPRRSTHVSNISVPLTIWARVAVRARLTESILGSSKVVGISPIPARTEDSEESNTTIANKLADFVNSQILSSRGLNGKAAIELCAAEDVDLGACALKVIPEPGTVRHTRPDATARGNAPRLHVKPPRVRWEHIPWMNLIYVNGFGTDTQAMPFIGHEFEQTWGEMLSWAKLGHYDSAAVEQVRESFASDHKHGFTEGAKPAHMRDHDLVELYLDWDVNGDGIEEAILITWHPKACKRIRTVWNPISDGTRPILIARFDLPNDISLAGGQGVSEKLEGSQDEVDMIHNLAIESSKRGTAHILVIKEGTRAEEEFGGDTDILPGDIIVTADPGADIVAVPLGDKDAALAAISIEEHTRVYVTRILGLDESKMGSVESGKRVTAQVGMTTIREGRMIIRSALASFANMLSEATYLTLDLYRQVPPITALRAALNDDDARTLATTVFSVSDLTLRSSFLINVNAQDAAISEENRKQEMLIINQALFPFYDRIQQIIVTLASPELPPQAKKPLVALVGRMERGMEALLNTVDSIPNPEELLIRIGEIEDMLRESNVDVLPEDPASPEAADSLVGDLGAGIA